MKARIVRLAVLATALIGSAISPRAEPASPARFRAMVERPLFSPTRRPPPPALAPLDAPVLPDLPPPGPDLSLSGVIAGGSGGGVALVRRPQDAAPVRIALGGEIDGWTLAEIRPRAVVLRHGDRSITVDLPAPGR